MLDLHILRHAKTEQFSPSGKDFDRYLMEKGLRQREELKHFFEGVQGIEQVWCSSANRTRQTLEPLLGSGLPEPLYSDTLYLCSYQELLKLLWEKATSKSILIVGHNFGISDLVNYFCDSDIELRTGQYVHITFECKDWSEVFRGTGTIAEVYRPEV